MAMQAVATGLGTVSAPMIALRASADVLLRYTSSMYTIQTR
jgi:hypothetical protein